ncbi:MAG: hypothetical protein HY921_04840 [Elusimicrobia bacterium]|nr:hypothetical protein [Elusimicrobiota bacterium]
MGKKGIFLLGIAWLLALELLGLLLYGALLGYPLVWDDHTFVEEQSFLGEPRNLKLVLDPRSLITPLPVRGSARPLWLASILADRAVYGERPWGLRLTGVLWHGLAAFLVLALAWLLSGRGLLAVAAALLFLCHPVHAEAVALVSYRCDSMAFVFAAFALFLYRRGWRAASLAAFAAALLSKESAVVFPALVLLSDCIFPEDGRPPKSRAAYLAAAAALLVLFLGFRAPRAGYRLDAGGDVFSRLAQDRPGLFSFFSRPSGLGRPPEPPPRPKAATPGWMSGYYRDPATRLRTSLAVWSDEVRLLLWPRRLQADYAPRPAQDWGDRRVISGLLLLVLLLGAGWRLRKSQPVLSFGLLWIPISLTPVSGMFLLRNLEAERYLFLPSAGACLAAAAVLSKAWDAGPSSRKAAGGALAALLILGGVRSWSRARDFRGDIELHEATVRADSGVARAHAALAEAYARAGRWDEAEREIVRAFELWPGYGLAREKFREMARSRNSHVFDAALLSLGPP